MGMFLCVYTLIIKKNGVLASLSSRHFLYLCSQIIKT